MIDSAASDLLNQLRHSHDYGAIAASHETKTRWVVSLTFLMMVAELVVGYVTNSLALTADGWHMATHVGALGMAAFAYWFARKQSASTAFSFGTGKVHALAGYTSAVVLALIALFMVAESLHRFLHPESIVFSEALPVAMLGLAVNLASAKILHLAEHHHPMSDDGHEEHEEHEHDEPHDHHTGNGAEDHGDHDHHHGHDQNLRSAYFHVLADALTSVLAIFALMGGRYFGWTFLDPAMGIVGGLVISTWSYGLCRQAARQLLDVVPSQALARRIQDRIEAAFAGTRVVDLHLWEIGPSARACIVSIATPNPQSPWAYREALDGIASLQHVTVEVHPHPAAG